MLGTILGFLATFASLITAWVTLKFTVTHHQSELKAQDERLKMQDQRIGKLERWREREIGAVRERRHHTTERLILPVGASAVDTSKKDE